MSQAGYGVRAGLWNKGYNIIDMPHKFRRKKNRVELVEFKGLKGGLVSNSIVMGQRVRIPTLHTRVE